MPGRTAGWTRKNPQNADTEPGVVPGTVHRDPRQARRRQVRSTSMPPGSGRRPRKCWNFGIFDALTAAPRSSRAPGLGLGRTVAVQRSEVSLGAAPARSPGTQSPHFQNLFASPLVVVAGFRAGVLAGLGDKTPLGTLVRSRPIHPAQDQERPDDQLRLIQPRPGRGRYRRGIPLPALRLARLATLGPRGLPRGRSLLARSSAATRPWPRAWPT